MRYPMSVEMVNEYGAHAVRVAIAEHEAMLDAAEVDGLIEELGKIRAHMQPAVATQPSRTHQYLLEIDPFWYIERNPLFDGIVLFLRHTGFGWTGFAIPTESLARMKEAIASSEPDMAMSVHAHALPN